MEARIKRLGKQRIRVFALCIGYFLLLLAVGSLIFLKDASYANVLVCICIAVYFLLVRPVLNRYKGQLRREILEVHLGRHLADMQYDPKGGFSREALENTNLAPVPLESFLSRELVTGRSGSFTVELADVTFPIRAGGKNQMFNGCAMMVTAAQGSYRPLYMEAGTLISGEPGKKEQQLLDEIGSLIPGSLYVSAQEQSLCVILRGRFLGWRINPLMEVTVNTLSFDPMPELKKVLELAWCLCK